MTIVSYREALTILSQRTNRRFNEAVEVAIMIGQSDNITITRCSTVILGCHQPNPVLINKDANIPSIKISSKISVDKVRIATNTQPKDNGILFQPGRTSVEDINQSKRDLVGDTKDIESQTNILVQLADRKVRFVLTAGKTTTIVIGKTNLGVNVLAVNVHNLMTQITKAKPTTVKLREFIKRVTLRSTMGSSIDITQIPLVQK